MMGFCPSGPVEDRLAIRDLAEGYAWSIDHRDPQSFAALFASNGRLVTYHGNDPHEPPRNVHIGADALSRIVSVLAEMYVRTYHFVGNHWSHVDGDRATAFTSCIAHHLSAEPFGHGATDYTMLIDYHDDLVRIDGAWRFSERRMLLQWSSLSPVLAEEVRGGGGIATGM